MQRDFYLRRGAAWNAAIWVLNSIGVVLLLWAISSEADSAQAGRDYPLPSQAKGGFISIPSSTESGQPSARSSSSKSLTPFNLATSRLTHVYGHGYDSEAPAPDSNGISGSRYDPSHTGDGFIVGQISTDEALVFWFTCDETGNPFWMFNSGAVFNGKIRIPQLLQPEGGHFGRSYDPESVIQHEWGELTPDLDCSSGTASYTMQAEGYSRFAITGTAGGLGLF